MTFEVNLHLMKIFDFIMFSFTQSFDKIRFMARNISDKKWIFKHKSDLLSPLMTSEVILYLMKNVHLYNVSIYRNLYKNRSIKKGAKKR